MSATAYETDETTVGQTMADNSDHGDLEKIRQRLRAAKADRRRFEPLWEECLAFAAGKHHLERSKVDRRRLFLPDLPKGRVRYTVDELSQYRETILGELSMDDDMPQLLFREEDQPDEDFAAQAEDLVAFGWETEWDGDEILIDVKQFLIDLGTGAVRCRFDATAGDIRQRVPVGQDGKAALDNETITALRKTGAMPDGSLPRFKPLHEGRIRWDAGSPFNLLPPPGIKRERDFPWEGWVEAVHIDRARELFPKLTLRPDALTDVERLGDRELAAFDAGPNDTEGTGQGKLADHVLVFTYYERPSAKFPKGRVKVFAGSGMQLAEERDTLDYQAPDGTWRSGIHYFHFMRLSNRFWSRGVIERGISPQRAINKRRSQIAEIIDRSLPKVYMARGAIERQPKGLALEVVYVDPSKPKPVVDNGPGVNQSMFQDVEALREDLTRAIGVNDVSVGENPAGVGNYSQLALLREQDGRKLDPVVNRIKLAVAGLVEDSLYDIHRYWPSGKQYAVAGPDGILRSHVFDKSVWPDFYRVTVPKGAAKPRSQAAMLKMVDDIATYSINARQPLPTDWVKSSYEAGRPVDLPEAPKDDQGEKARYENGLLADGQDPGVDYFDDHALHVLEHRSLQIQAKLAGRLDIYEVCEQHIQAHLAAAAQGQQTIGQPPLPQPAGGPAAPPTSLTQPPQPPAAGVAPVPATAAPGAPA